MGLFGGDSSSSSQVNNTTSNTSYTPTINDAENPLTVTGSRNEVGDAIVRGNATNVQYTQSDAGAIKSSLEFAGTQAGKSFDYTSKTIAEVIDLTKGLIEGTFAQNALALNFSQKASDKALALADENGTLEAGTNTTLWVAAGLVALWLLIPIFRK